MDTVDYLGQAKHPDIKFAHRSVAPMWAADENRFLDVFLYDPIFVRFLLEKFFDFGEIIKDFDSSSSIGVLSRFANPKRWFFIRILIKNLLEFFIIVHITLCSKRISYRQQLLNIFINNFLIEFMHCLKQICFICQIIIASYFGIYLFAIKLICNTILLPLRPEKFDLLK